MRIRQETLDDALLVEAIEYAAFKNHPLHAPGAEPTEHRIVHALREGGALSVSLLAEADGQALGHIALSPAGVGDAGNWLLLGPVGVLPGHRGRGLGSALVRAAVDRARARGAEGVVLVGDPGFYGRFGFAAVPGLTWPGVPDRYVLALPLAGPAPQGVITPHSAFRTA
ncbi:MAG: N-acetyltransferase [Pseudodesulfovibrio sp.]